MSFAILMERWRNRKAMKSMAQIVCEELERRVAASGFKTHHWIGEDFGGGDPYAVHVQFDFDCPCGNMIRENIAIPKDYLYAWEPSMILDYTARTIVAELQAHVKGDGK